MAVVDRNAIVVVTLDMVEEGLEVIITPFGLTPHYEATARREGKDIVFALRDTRLNALTEALSLLRWTERKQT